MSPKVSVIIPVYNVERYLNKCVESVLNQTFQDFEIILVDDGSTDKSGEICDSYINEKIRVIHKKNGGLSDARNVGTKESKGEYITWIDSDDTVHSDYLKVLVMLVELFNADISIGELLSVYDGEEILYTNKTHYEKCFNGEEALNLMLYGNIRSTSACCMLIRNDIARKYLFPVGKYHEDDFTTYKFYLAADKVAYSDQKLYFYYQRSGSIMHKPFSKIDIDELDAADNILNYCLKYSIKHKDAAFVRKAEVYCHVLFKFTDLRKIDSETYNRIMSFLNQNRIDFFKNENIKAKTKIKFILYRMRLLSISMNVHNKMKNNGKRVKDGR